MTVCHPGGMSDEQPTDPQPDDDFDDVLGEEADAPVDEYRLSTRPALSVASSSLGSFCSRL